MTHFSLHRQKTNCFAFSSVFSENLLALHVHIGKKQPDLFAED